MNINVTELKNFLRDGQLKVSIGQLIEDAIARRNVEELLREHAQGLVDEILEEGNSPEFVLESEIPELVLIFTALKQLHQLEEHANSNPELNLIEDYALWVGIQMVESELTEPQNLSPMVYVEEFMHSAWVPDKEVVEEFLIKFYPPDTVRAFFVDNQCWDIEEEEV